MCPSSSVHILIATALRSFVLLNASKLTVLINILKC